MPAPCSIAELPLMTELLDPRWGADLPATLGPLFARTDTNLLQSPDGSVVVYRNADLRALAGNRAVGNLPAPLLAAAFNMTSDDGESRFQRLVANHVFTMNPPLHGPMRNLFARQFMPGNVVRFAPIAETIVEELVGHACDRGEIDYIAEFTNVLAVRFWGELIGLTPDEEGTLTAMSEQIAPAFFLGRSEQQTEAVERIAGEYLTLVSGAIDRTLAAGTRPFLAEMAEALASAEVDGKPVRIGLLLGAILMDGFHTMAVGLANVSYALLANRAAHDRVRADPLLVTSAFYEGVRLETAATFTQRYALDDLAHHDVAIPKGTPITMLWYAGNRDPAAFEQPDSYDLGRSIGGGTTFGGGIHLCPGRSITKLLAEIVLTVLTRADVRVSLSDSTPPWLAGSSMHQLERMPVSFTRL